MLSWNVPHALEIFVWRVASVNPPATADNPHDMTSTTCASCCFTGAPFQRPAHVEIEIEINLFSAREEML